MENSNTVAAVLPKEKSSGSCAKGKKKRGRSRRKTTLEAAKASKAIYDWFYSEKCVSTKHPDDFAAEFPNIRGTVAFEFHCHSKFSDGFLSPSSLVAKAHSHGVKVLALTDHDTMAGIPEAVEASSKLGMKIIPGVEISTIFATPNSEESVHILAYYGRCGPTSFDELEDMLSSIRLGRYSRAKEMVLKLNKLKIPLKLEHVMRIAGKEVAPGRLHVARALLEAGHVETLKQAFTKYLHDGGPAYCTGSEPTAEEAVKLTRRTGGVSVLAHPWGLKNASMVVKRLKEVGLDGVEVYRSDGKLNVYSDLAERYGLLKLGGSDFHGRGSNESEIGSVRVPVSDLHKFLLAGCPLWLASMKDILTSCVENPCESNLRRITRFGIQKVKQENHNFFDYVASTWMTEEERQKEDIVAIRLKFSKMSL